MNSTIGIKGTFTIATKYVNNFKHTFINNAKNIKFNTVEPKILETNERMAPLNRGAWISLTDIDLELPKFIGEDNYELVGAAFYPNNDTYSHIILPGSGDVKIKKDNSLISSGKYFYYFIKRQLFYSTGKLEETLVRFELKDLKEKFGEDFMIACHQWAIMFNTYAKTVTEKDLRVYRVENIYSAALSVTENWNTWTRGSSSHEIFNKITKNDTLPVGIRDVKDAIKGIATWYERSNNQMCKEVCNSLYLSDGSFKHYFSRNEIGPLSYAFFAWEKEKRNVPNHKNPGRHLKLAWETPITAEGQLYYKGQSNNRYGVVNNYILEGDDGNYYYLNTTVDIEELTSGRCVTARYRISGKLGQQWTSRGREYFGVNFNNIKGRLKIDRLS